MSNRFHSKYHRHNHHTDANPDPRYPDSSHDPIASPDSPFMGNFVMYGGISATTTEISALAGSFVNSVDGLGLRVVGGTELIGPVSAVSLHFTGNNISYFSEFEPLSATGEFLLITIRDGQSGAFEPRAIRLWNGPAVIASQSS